MRTYKKHTEQEIIEIAKWFIINKSNVRAAAKHFKTGKSSIHYVLTNQLRELNPQLYKLVKTLLTFNREIRNIIGGEVTHNVFKNIRERNNKDYNTDLINDEELINNIYEEDIIIQSEVVDF